MRLFAILSLFALAAVAFLGRAFDFVLTFASPRHFDQRAYMALNPAPRSIFDTRRMGLA
jgi:hypothetical protein